MCQRNEDLFKEIWENGIITFDTCSLGRMYEWEYSHSVNIKDALSYLFQFGCIWECEVTCKEFEVQRKQIKEGIYQQKYENGIFKNLDKRPIPWSKIDKALKRWESLGFHTVFTFELDKLRTIKNPEKSQIESLRQLSILFSTFPDVEVLFDSLLNSRDTSLTDIEKGELIELYESGIVCPGCCDNKKNNGNKYNDLFIWASIKKKARNTNKNIVFVTNDVKSDWFVNNAPRKEYIEEFQSETSQSILILTLSDFWVYCKPFIDMPVDEFILQSTILQQLEEKYDDCYEPQITQAVEDLLDEPNESNDLIQIIEDSLDCCVDMLLLDEILDCDISYYDISYNDEDNVTLSIYLNAEISLDAQNHTCGEDWSPGCDSVLFDIEVAGTIPIKWSSDETERILLEDKITVNEIINIEIISNEGTDDPDDYNEQDDYDEPDDYYETYDIDDFDEQ